ncbi:MAG: UDP-glucose/GDP-mannose dehydrogenase family protein [Bacteroidales bacterium]|jgi:UDPglucose 6-dehydrogenase|nr:UDP-glucose/GDP-mannose dehydrogenase family protein [Bacteroidales bacterium]HOL97670.1 UDP-glucose/GDP-mannose dehydrogenase family protein [Bacteroidales bacterium]HOM37256.1 UDP-glucose/GDP-mannose dehydrogenase family protein [Bacteroidales bacterium]HPD24817.1 UDP-glucose/GDP-mannose dehydrogenase family protein [Bacteroidales bacterium]HRT00338.1 UDP-glucose/GDP-mannose dehydrogenase family protein [Bacteroidales bacterium]
MKISIVGTGYVGLVSGTCFSEMGIITSCVDIDEAKIEKLKKGIMPIWEPGLEEMVKRNVEKGRLSFTTSLKESLVDADACFIAVGTPPDEDGSADLQYVLGVAHEIGKHINNYMVVVTKSTVPIGTSEKVRMAVKEEIQKRGVNIEFDVVSNPEFLKEGDAIEDCLHPDRIVVGTDSERAKKIMDRLYKPFVLNGHPIIYMDIPSAELTKYAANAMLATKISFMNDIANFCELVGADINSVRKGIGSDHRIGPYFIYAGMGYGGSCFPKDVKALIRTAEEYNYSLKILKAVDDVNNTQKSTLYRKALKHFNGDLKDKKFAIWGLSFKPNTDDMREAPSLVLIKNLLDAGAKIYAYDPVAMHEAKRIFGNKINYVEDPYFALDDADGMFLVTEWTEFRILNYPKMEKMKNKVIFDGRNIYEPQELRQRGFVYYSIGRK